MDTLLCFKDHMFVYFLLYFTLAQACSKPRSLPQVKVLSLVGPVLHMILLWPLIKNPLHRNGII